MTPEERITGLEAQCAALRHELQSFSYALEANETEADCCWCDDVRRDGTHEEKCLDVRAALSCDAGKALLKRLEKAEASYQEITPEFRDKLLHCTPETLVNEIEKLRSMLGKAECERDEWKRNAEVVESAANAWADDAKRLQAVVDELRLAGTREALGRTAKEARIAALEEAAQVTDGFKETERGESVDTGVMWRSGTAHRIAAAIRALKEKK